LGGRHRPDAGRPTPVRSVHRERDHPGPTLPVSASRCLHDALVTVGVAVPRPVRDALTAHDDGPERHRVGPASPPPIGHPGFWPRRQPPAGPPPTIPPAHPTGGSRS